MRDKINGKLIQIMLTVCVLGMSFVAYCMYINQCIEKVKIANNEKR